MAGQNPTSQRRAERRRHIALTTSSGILDWLLVAGIAVGGYFLGNMTPNKRPFQLEDPDISFPYTVHETVTSKDLVLSTILVPVVVILIVTLLGSPGSTTLPGTPKSVIIRCKLWELYSSLLSFALGMASQWFIVNGLKNLCGKPRPDLLARCQPDLSNAARYVVGGIANTTSNGQRVSAHICQNTDTSILNDGFRSYPSGHSASSAAGLGFLALFLAFKFNAVFPYNWHWAFENPSTLAAFPHRSRPIIPQKDVYELIDRQLQNHPEAVLNSSLKESRSEARSAAESHEPVLSARHRGAAPPLYLLVFALVPFCASIFIAASRWFNFRHHGFDILFGYFIGTTTALVAFRMYHLPFSHGGGWAWGPRFGEKAFWSGVGSGTWAAPEGYWPRHTADEEDCLSTSAQQEPYHQGHQVLPRTRSSDIPRDMTVGEGEQP